ncbi:hypothetical protein ACF1BS_17895 [Streptomyces sp. NPDC014748]|uniref:hypothetical protein n=1 Tax=Streptomyces sp. NPDC014748 TaxID=3364905 RepID=UPI003701E805
MTSLSEDHSDQEAPAPAARAHKKPGRHGPGPEDHGHEATSREATGRQDADHEATGREDAGQEAPGHDGPAPPPPVVACARCGAPADGPPPTWTCSVENGVRRYFCDACSREHLRAIEGRLDSAWW